jgi:hypothetical protein
MNVSDMYFSSSAGAVASLGKEQFLGLYMSAGVISSMSSYFHKAVTKQPGLSLGAVSYTNISYVLIKNCFKIFYYCIDNVRCSRFTIHMVHILAPKLLHYDR